MTGTTPRAIFSEVSSASVPTVRGASTTANEDIATTRPLARADCPGASATASDTPIGNKFPSPIPSSDKPASAGAGAVDGHRTANPAAVRAPDQHATEVAGHHGDRGGAGHPGGVLNKRRAPGGDAPLGRGRAEQHRGRDPEHHREAAPHGV